MKKAVLSGAAILGALALWCCSSESEPGADLQARVSAFRDRLRGIEHGEIEVPLEGLDQEMTSWHGTDNDLMVLKAIREFGTSLTDAELRAIPDLAREPRDADLRWTATLLLIDRGFFDDAAALIVTDALANPENSDYRLWKWMESTYGHRPDYREVCESLGDGLLAQFADGSPEDKLAIAGLFGRGEVEAALDLEAFKKEIGRSKE